MRKTKKVIRRIFTVVIIFLFVFAASFVGFGYLVNKYTPEVDVQIGNTTGGFDNRQINIDNRLKDIQDEDNGVTKEETEEEKEEEKSPEEEEEIEELMPSLNQKTEEVKEEKVEKETAPLVKAPIPQKSEIANQAAENSAPMPANKTKVFAGYYTSLEEAVEAQQKLDTLLPDVSPFVKEMNGYYIVQIGVYSNPNSADDMYNKVKALNFPAKTKSE